MTVGGVGMFGMFEGYEHNEIRHSFAPLCSCHPVMRGCCCGS